MKNYLKYTAMLLAAAIISGCSKIPDYTVSGDLSDDTEQEQSSESSGKSDAYTTSDYIVVKQNFLSKLNAEGGVFEDAYELVDGDFDGKSYLRFKEKGKLTHIVNANTTQFYRIIIAARSENGAAIKLYIKKRAEGEFYIPPASENSENSFEYYAVDSVYLSGGSNVMDFEVEKGDADIDYILVENSDAVDPFCYKTGTSAVNPSASLETVGVVKYLTEIYGTGVLTAANVSFGTNAEIEAVYKATGRYPAIRTSELAAAVLDDEESMNKVQKDTELALEWGKNNGIVSYKWHWYSPNTRRSVDLGAFDTHEALDVTNLEDVALMTSDELITMVENNFLSPYTVTLLNDIDKIALVLELFSKEKIPVIFEPVPSGDSGLYWWGNNAEDYQKLYRLIFDRLCRYHKLSNLIWVWNGGSTSYYPGADYCDIIGQSIFENSDSSFAGRFSVLSDSFLTRKPIAATSRDVLPNADFMKRDNALWLWSAVESGKYIIKENGMLSSEYNSLSSLNTSYNSTLFITRDELPDLSTYAVGVY